MSPVRPRDIRRARHEAKGAPARQFVEAMACIQARPMPRIVDILARQLAHRCGPDGCEHASDCAVHNEPALPNGPCDCGLSR